MKKALNPVFTAGIFFSAFIFNACTKTDLTGTSFSDTGPSAQASSVNNIRTVSRPFSDYLNAQGSTSHYTSLVPDFLVWADPMTADYSVYRWALIDYNGTSAKYLKNHGGPVISTSVTGSIRETKTTDGKAKVTVVVHTENALTFSFTSSFSPSFQNDLLDFGYRATDLLANPLLKPALGTSDLSITFYNKQAGDPIPDLVELVNNRLEDIVSLSFQSRSTGTFHAISGYSEGTQGSVRNIQRRLWFKLNSSFKGNSDHPKDQSPRASIIYSIR